MPINSVSDLPRLLVCLLLILMPFYSVESDLRQGKETQFTLQLWPKSCHVNVKPTLLKTKV